MDLLHNLCMQTLIISSPWALGGFWYPLPRNQHLIMIFLWSKEKSDGNVLPLSINEHCFAKKELNISLFSLKSVINLLS